MDYSWICWTPESPPTLEINPEPVGWENALKNFLFALSIVYMALFIGLKYILYRPVGYNYYREKLALSAVTIFAMSIFGKHFIVENLLRR